MHRWGLKTPSVLDHTDPRSKIPDHFDDSDAKGLRSQISELLKPSDPRSEIPDPFDHSDAKALRSDINFIDFSSILESPGGHFGTSGASRRASWLQVPPRTLPGPSQDPPGELPGGSRS